MSPAPLLTGLVELVNLFISKENYLVVTDIFDGWWVVLGLLFFFKKGRSCFKSVLLRSSLSHLKSLFVKQKALLVPLSLLPL